MTRHGEVGRPLRVGVEHRVDLGPRPVNLGVDREFQRRFDVAAIDRLAVEIDRDDVLHGQRGAYRGAGVDVERVGVAPHAAMAVVVDVFRMLQHAEYIDHNGHCSVRRDANSFYINSGASIRASLTVEDIVAVDLDGKPVDGGNVKPPLEFPIHAEVYRARPKVNAVFHTHPQWSTYLTMTGHPQKVVYAQASLLGDMPVMNSPMSVNTREMGEKMVGVMGDNQVVM